MVNLRAKEDGSWIVDNLIIFRKYKNLLSDVTLSNLISRYNYYKLIVQKILHLHAKLQTIDMVMQ